MRTMIPEIADVSNDAAPEVVLDVETPGLRIWQMPFRENTLGELRGIVYVGRDAAGVIEQRTADRHVLYERGVDEQVVLDESDGRRVEEHAVTGPHGCLTVA